MAGMPTSWQAEIRCVPISPFVLAPQMKNVPASTQNARVRDANARAVSGAIAAAGAGGGASAARPYGVSPMSAGRSRMNIHTITNTTAAAAATISAADRQFEASTTAASIGRNTSCPVAFAADSMPITRPRRSSNQRVATTAASTIAVTPVPAPTTTPHNRKNCHSADMRVDNATADVISARAPRTTRRRPQRSITEAAKGPISPNSAMLTAIDAEITARLQPNSASSGTMNRPGAARTPDVISMTTNVTRAMTQA